MPPQLPKGQDAASLEAAAESAGNAVKGMMIIQLVAQVFLKGALNNLWSLLFTLQMCCFLALYKIPIPSNGKYYLDNYTDLIRFEVLKPEGLVRLWDKDFVLKDWIQGQKNIISSPDEKVSSFYDLLFYIIGAGIGLTFVIGMIVLIFVLPLKYKDKIKAKLDGALKKFFWNGAIRSVYISYIEIAINCGA